MANDSGRYQREPRRDLSIESNDPPERRDDFSHGRDEDRERAINEQLQKDMENQVLETCSSMAEKEARNVFLKEMLKRLKKELARRNGVRYSSVTGWSTIISFAVCEGARRWL